MHHHPVGQHQLWMTLLPLHRGEHLSQAQVDQLDLFQAVLAVESPAEVRVSACLRASKGRCPRMDATWVGKSQAMMNWIPMVFMNSYASTPDSETRLPSGCEA